MRKLLIIAVVTVAAAAGYLVQDRRNDAVVAQGTVRAVTTVQVRSPISGQIREISADFRTPVKSGQVLARMDATSFEHRVNQARVDLDAARLAKDALAIKQREILLKQAELDLERTVIRAPVDGTVILRNANVGQTVAPGTQAPALFTIAPDLRTVQIEAALDEADTRQLRVGLPVTFSVDALPRRAFSGEIRQVRKGANKYASYAVLIEAANADLALVPGMTANVRIPPAP